VTDCIKKVADRNTDIVCAQTLCGAAKEQHYISEIRGTKQRAILSLH
jgi:hypothetical protein